jgi:hypothetical protein
VTVAREHGRSPIVALVRALAILAAAFVIGHGAVPEARVATSAIRALHAEIKARTIDSAPARVHVISRDHAAPDAHPATALPPGVLSVHDVACEGRVPAPPSVRAPRRFVFEPTPVARGPPALV